jgi:hypothetical protein
VEMIGTGLVVQHYAYKTAGKDHWHMVSISDVLTPWLCQLQLDFRVLQPR